MAADPYTYALMPYEWVTFTRGALEISRWEPPNSAVGGVDLRPIDAQASAGGTPEGVGLFAMTQARQGIGLARSRHINEASVTESTRDAWAATMRFRPVGDTLTDLLFDQLTRGADPDGWDGPLPLMPTVNGFLELHLGGHSLIRRERFRWGPHAHTAKVQAKVQRDFQRMWESRGGDPHCQRVLDAWCEKYRVDDWRDLVPAPLRPHVPGRLPHHTTLVDDFNRANQLPLGTASGGFVWTTYRGILEVVSNQAHGESSGDDEGRATDLSTDDHYAQATAGASFIAGTGNYLGVICRKDTSATLTFYRWCNFGGDGGWELVKFVASTETALDTAYTTDPAVGDTFKIQADGSTISAYHPIATSRASLTDTSITGNLCGGITAGGGNAASFLDTFETADLAASATFEQLHYRWRNDDGSETTATFAAAEDTPP